MLRAEAIRLPMAHPGDVSALAERLAAGTLAAEDIVAVIGKTEGNGGVNDFTRGYFTQSLMALLSQQLDETPSALTSRIPCVLSGGTEGVLTPHYVVFSRTETAGAAASEPALAVGTAMSAPLAPEHVGRAAHVASVIATVEAAMKDARIDDPRDIAMVQVKSPCVTSARASAAMARGATVLTADPGRSMAFARAAGTFGVAAALGDITWQPACESALLQDFAMFSSRASISSGVEVECNEVIVLGNSSAWSGPLRIASHPMTDALDIEGIVSVLVALGIDASPQISTADRERLRGVFVKCEPDRRGAIRGGRHTMLDDTDINAQRHIRGALGGLVCGVLGDTRVFVSGGAEHQGPDGGGLIAVIAEARDMHAVSA